MKGVIDRVAGSITAAAGSLALWQAVKLYKYRAGLIGGDHVFPMLIGFGLLGLGIWLAVFPENRESENGETPPPRTKAWPGLTAVLPNIPKEAVIPVVLLGYTMLLPLAGYLISTFAASFLLFATLGGYRWPRCLLGAAVATLCLDLVFIEWLNTPLPAGRLLTQIRG